MMESQRGCENGVEMAYFHTWTLLRHFHTIFKISSLVFAKSLSCLNIHKTTVLFCLGGYASSEIGFPFLTDYGLSECKDRGHL